MTSTIDSMLQYAKSYFNISSVLKDEILSPYKWTITWINVDQLLWPPAKKLAAYTTYQSFAAYPTCQSLAAYSTQRKATLRPEDEIMATCSRQEQQSNEGTPKPPEKSRTQN